MTEANWIEPRGASRADIACLLAICAAAMLAMFPWSMDPYQSPRLLMLAVLCVPLLARRSNRGSLITVPALLLLSAWTVCALASSDRSSSLVGSTLAPFDGLTAAVVYVAVLVSIARLGITVEDAASSVCLVSMPLSAYAIAQRFVHDPLLPAALSGGRVIATQGSPVYLGAVLAIVAAAAMALLSGPRRRLAMAALVLCLPALWFTGTRGALIATAMAGIVLVPSRFRWAMLLGLPLSALLPRLIAVRADLGRIEIWKEAVAVFRAHPILGSGPGTFEMVSRAHISPAYIAAQGSAYIVSQSAHNLVLQVLATTGVLGFLAASVFAFSAIELVTSAPEGERRILAAAGVAFAAVSMVNPVPHAAVVLVAVLFGAASGINVLKPSRYLALAGLALASVAVTGRVAASDWHYKRAVVAGRAGAVVDSAYEFSRAAELNPWDMRLVSMRIDSALQIATRLSPEDRRTLGAMCLGWARAGAAAHPNDALAHEVLGRAVLIARSVGLEANPMEAAGEFQRAQALAPTFPPIMQRRRALAAALGDHAGAAAAARDLQLVAKLTGGI